MAELTNRIIASFYGLAFGDALGQSLATLSFDELQDEFPCGAEDVEFEDNGQKFLVGDDTQMALFCSLGMRSSILDGSYREKITKYLTFWFDDPLCNRGASQHTMSALAKYKQGIHWNSATNISLNRSDVMARGASIAYWNARDGEQEEYWNLAFLQASITHCHPVGLVASALYVESLIWLLNKKSYEGLITHLLKVLPKIEICWQEKFNDKLWQYAGYSSSAEFLGAGVKKCQKKLKQVFRYLKNREYIELDPSSLFGEGWQAEEALAIALYSFLSYPENSELAVKRAVLSNGPSDTLGAMTGALAGAWGGTESWPGEWYTHIEYKEEILELGRIIGRRALL